MITKLTAANDRELFAPRFEQITAALAEAAETDNSITPVEINSLESYYANLVSISKLQTRKGAAGKYLLVVPADEPYFEIDANTRTIAIPPHFKKNGVGVQGDNEAELIVFKIDRYFDYKDFMETKIAINWNFTPTGQRLPIYEETQAQPAFAPDDELEPGYVVFGFFVTKDMTPSKGTLSFSVTCYTDANDKIEYSFNTQTAVVNINEGLTLAEPSVLKDIVNGPSGLLNRISDSAFTPESATPIDTPVWELGDLDEENKKMGLPEKLNFNLRSDGTEDETLPITAQASTTGADIKYTWYSAPENGNIEVVREPNVVTSPADYFITMDEEINDHSVYYKQEDNLYTVISGAELEEAWRLWKNPEENEDRGDPIYELGSTYNALGAGRYQVKAQGEKIIVSGGSNLRIVSEQIESNVCLVPPAAKPEVVLEVETTLNEERDGFTVIDDSEGYKYISAEYPPVINAIVTSTNEEALGAVAVEVLQNSQIVDLDEEAIINAGYNFIKCPDDGTFQVNAQGVTQEGIYRVRAINRRNHTYSVSDPSEEIKTSFIAPRITKLNVYNINDNTRIFALEEGAQPSDNSIDPTKGRVFYTNSSNPSITFVIDDMTEAANKYMNAVTTYIVEEVIDNGDGTYSVARAEADPDEFEVIFNDAYVDAYHNSDNNNVGAYVFTITSDSGLYRIRTENRYNGTLVIGYTSIFTVANI